MRWSDGQLAFFALAMANMPFWRHRRSANELLRTTRMWRDSRGGRQLIGKVVLRRLASPTGTW